MKEMWILSLFLVGFGVVELARQELSLLAWKETQGTVIDSQTTQIERDSEGLNVSAPQFTVTVRYQYTVDGIDYESTRMTTGDPELFYWAQEAAEFRKQFRPGDPITVLYAPDSPSEATLVAERGSGPWILLGFGIPTLALTAYLQFRRRRNRQNPDPAATPG